MVEQLLAAKPAADRSAGPSAEAHGVNTLVIHTAPGIVSTLKKYRYKLGGKIQWIICPTAQVDTQQEDYRKQVKQLVD